MMCSGAIIHFGIPRVVVGETESYPGYPEFLRDNGIEVDKHYDDCPYELKSLKEQGIETERVWHPFDEENLDYGND